MEAFEHVCKVALQSEGFVVTSNLKFYVRRRTKKKAYAEHQTHGYEVDLVGVRKDRLVLAEVKSFFGSRGVHRQSFRGLADEGKKTDFGGYKLLNDAELRASVVNEAASQFGFNVKEVEMRLYVGKFAKGHEEPIKAHFANFSDPPVEVLSLDAIMEAVIRAAEIGTYTDDPVVVAVKALKAAGRIRIDDQGNADAARASRLREAK